MTNEEIVEFKRLLEKRLSDASVLGKYTFKNGQTRPACCLLPDKTLGFDYPPADTITVGIECVVMKPQILHKRFFNGYQLRNKFDIYLKDFGKGAELFSATRIAFDTAFEYHYEVTNPVFIPANKLKNIIPQSTFSAIHWENVAINYIA